MMKYSQSLLDFINFLPLQGIVISRSPISDKEARVLMDIWKGDRDNYGNFVVANEIDRTSLSSLTSKGMLKSKQGNYALDTTKMAIEITKKGQELIRNIILHGEESAFEKSPAKFSYEAIHNKVHAISAKSATTDKTASLNHPTARNWLERVMNGNKG